MRFTNGRFVSLITPINDAHYLTVKTNKKWDEPIATNPNNNNTKPCKYSKDDKSCNYENIQLESDYWIKYNSINSEDYSVYKVQDFTGKDY